MSDEPPKRSRRAVRRGEGEVTEWPRGLVEYVPKGAPDSVPSPDDDRDLNRLRLASRLLGFARAQGLAVDPAVGQLRAADRAFREGDRAQGRRLVDSVLSEVERLLDPETGAGKPTS